MRTITDHKINGLNNGLNDALTINVLDEPGQGGACHKYEVTYPLPAPIGGMDPRGGVVALGFQEGQIQASGVNGISNEALVAIVIDRLRGFQSGGYANNETMHALVHAEHCLRWLNSRTLDRFGRGVLGTYQK